MGNSGGNQYRQLVKVLYHKPTASNYQLFHWSYQLPAFLARLERQYLRQVLLDLLQVIIFPPGEPLIWIHLFKQRRFFMNISETVSITNIFYTLLERYLFHWRRNGREMLIQRNEVLM